MKYHSVTYSGPLRADDRRHEIDRHEQQAGQGQRIDPDRRFAPLHALAPSENGKLASAAECACNVGPNTMPTAVASTTTCQATKMNYDKRRSSTGLKVSRGMAQCSAPRNALARKP